ncbi:unnamed protein product [Gongylonema pulchrum]|uniref:CRM1_C domain-containing protein n=1 Tax=Gongylonema pulchrum TaxID=637853 RepID=A0A183CZP8_9BILA|nr:unnamed protein product [Gongylonema pulchrum]
MTTTVMPVLQETCASLFQHLNETFRTGLEQYMEQVQTLCASTLKTTGATVESSMTTGGNSGHADRSTLISLIENNLFAAAFEKALTQKDFGALMFVCNNVDPEIIGNDEQPLPQNIILCLLNQLGAKLDGETDLKFRRVDTKVFIQYIENALMALQVKDPTVAGSYRHVLNRLQTFLTAYMAEEENAGLKRRARIISQLAANMLK